MSSTANQTTSERVTGWIGTPASVFVHTLLFAGAFALPFWGISFDHVLLVLTTIVSLEAIYLAIFIQMTVNRNTASLAGVEEDIEDIHEEVEDLGEDVEEISEDIDRIQGDAAEEESDEEKTRLALMNIETNLQKIAQEIEAMRTRNISHAKIDADPNATV